MSVTALEEHAVVGLDVLLSAEGGSTVVALRGEADIFTVPVIVAALAGVIAERDGSVVVDLAQTKFIDTAALRAVLRAREILAGGERELTLRSPSVTAGRMLSVFGLCHLVGAAQASGHDHIRPPEEVHSSHQLEGKVK